jgi:hypothetical protein
MSETLLRLLEGLGGSKRAKVGSALTLAFGVAGLVVAIVFAAVMGGMWGMMGGNGGWMHGSVGTGPAYGGSMMGGGAAFIFSAMVFGFLGGALAGSVSAAVYNNIVGRSA